MIMMVVVVVMNTKTVRRARMRTEKVKGMRGMGLYVGKKHSSI